LTPHGWVRPLYGFKPHHGALVQCPGSRGCLVHAPVFDWLSGWRKYSAWIHETGVLVQFKSNLITFDYVLPMKVYIQWPSICLIDIINKVSIIFYSLYSRTVDDKIDKWTKYSRIVTDAVQMKLKEP